MLKLQKEARLESIAGLQVARLNVVMLSLREACLLQITADFTWRVVCEGYHLPQLMLFGWQPFTLQCPCGDVSGCSAKCTPTCTA